VVIGLFLLLSSCEEELFYEYENFIIQKGSHSPIFNVEALQKSDLSFYAIFDSSAIYTSKTPENQWDINKLYGFSDCNDSHHTNSARIGWRWLNENLEIHGYVYQGGVRASFFLGNVTLGEPHFYSIKLLSDVYSFQLNNNPPIETVRMNGCEKGFYYKLFPYFGGDERAPHDILISINEI
jgi:hypothetical protein